MDQRIGELINDCLNLESKIIKLICFQLAFINISTLRKTWGLEISKEKRTFLKGEGNKLGGLNKLRKTLAMTVENYGRELSKLAELLDKEDFEIENFYNRVDENQFSWLRQNIREIKDYLAGSTGELPKFAVYLDEEGFEIQKQVGGLQFLWISRKLNKIKDRLEGR
jgi:hypothetical protein